MTDKIQSPKLKYRLTSVSLGSPTPSINVMMKVAELAKSIEEYLVEIGWESTVTVTIESRSEEAGGES